MAVTVEQVKENPRVQAYIRWANRYLDRIGYTDHGFRHTDLVSKIAYNILSHLGYDSRTCELAAVAAYMHDMGNVAGRYDHEQSGALMAMQILNEMGMDPEEQAQVSLSIALYHEPVSEIGAAVILADKSDVHRSRVMQPGSIGDDIHDRVNYAVTRSFVRVNKEQRQITLSLEIDTKISDIMDYFSIFLERMGQAQKAANYLDCQFGLMINDVMLMGATSKDAIGEVVASSSDVRDDIEQSSGVGEDARASKAGGDMSARVHRHDMREQQDMAENQYFKKDQTGLHE